MSEAEQGAAWRGEEIGRLYDRIGAIREHRLAAIGELENTGRDEELQRILDETQAVIDALTDRIEFLIEHGAEWYDQDAGDGPRSELRRLWDYLEAEAKLIEEWEREHLQRPLQDIAEELRRLHASFRRDIEELDRELKEHR